MYGKLKMVFTLKTCSVKYIVKLICGYGNSIEEINVP